MKVVWDGILTISEGDEIEILRGIVEDGEIRASTLMNITKGTRVRSRIEGVMMIKMPSNLDPPIRGYAS